MAVAWKNAFWEGGVDKSFLLKLGQGETKPTGPKGADSIRPLNNHCRAIKLGIFQPRMDVSEVGI
jgi:hypothetical protein